VRLPAGHEARADGSRRVGTFLRIEGQGGSEITGPAFTSAGDRLYVSSQRGADGRGITYELTGTFSGPGSALKSPGR
jgi:hypothetical protein